MGHAPLEFPFDEVRPLQREMLQAIEDAADEGLLLLCAAPTGVGKTAAALFPLLRRALREERRLVFATSRVSQQELALDTIERMLPAQGASFALQISARDRICPRDALGCESLGCPNLPRFSERLARSDLLDELASLGVVRRDEIARRSLARRLCPYEVALELSRRATAIVCDVHYVFHPNQYLRHWFDVAHDRHLLIVDEAHTLPDRIREAHSSGIDLARLAALAERCDRSESAAAARASLLLRRAHEHCTRRIASLAAEHDSPPPWLEPPDLPFWQDLGPRAEAAILACRLEAARTGASWSSEEGERRNAGHDPLLSALGTLHDFGRSADQAQKTFAALWDTERVRLLCLDPAPFAGERIRGFHSAVCMSATLSPFAFHARELGLDPRRTVELDLGSPFPRENRLFLAVPTVDTRYRHRSAEAGRIAELIARCTSVRRGNYLAFFPSFAFRDQVVASLPRTAMRVLLQLPGMPTEPFLRQLRANQTETILLCAVHGGVFAEGVDYPGDMAIGVFVVGPGLPQVSVERELARSRYEREGADGFAFAYLYPGLRRVVQAGGRAIRGPGDRAVIVLLGRRFAEPLYRDALPAWWREELVTVDDPVPALERFWAAGPDGPG